MLTPDFALYVLAGLIAQLIDGALGMAYGVISSSLLLAFGVPPAIASATVHTSEVFTTGASALSHHALRNIDRVLFRKLMLPGMVGAILGAYILSNFPGQVLRPYIAGYLIVMGAIIVLKAFREFPPREVTSHLIPLGLVGGFIDAIGGGGWGPIVASNLIARGSDIRKTIGSVNAVEFFVTSAAALTFLVTLGLSHWQVVLGLAVGGVLAAPLGALVVNKIPVRPLIALVGMLIMLLSLRTLLESMGVI